MRDLPAGTITLLFTDIEGSTHLLQRLGERYAELLNECRTLLRAAFSTYHGQEVDTQGDAMFAAFARASDALAAAVAAQRELAGHSWPAGEAVRVRMGLHTGEPSRIVEGYVGLDVHYAARVMSAAHGGQVLLSQTTRDLVEHDLPEGVSLRDLGEHHLKDLEQAVHLYQVVIAGLPADFPPLRTHDRRSDTLPVQPTPLIGREHEVTAVVRLLRREKVRLVTLTGPGGTGKTRLALQVAAELGNIFTGGVFFVSLASLNDPALVIPTIARTLGIWESVGQPVFTRLVEVLQDKQALLLLDNFEQVIEAAPQLADLLASCPQLKLLVTSREVLHVRSEREFAVPPLALPDPDHLPKLAALARIPAVTLFLQRAQAVRPEFKLRSTNARTVAEICVRLDGLPLAIELAAARMKLLSPQTLLARLDQPLNLLTGGARDVPARQQTLRNTIEWSYQLLNAREQRIFRWLSVFVGGCSLQAAETVCTGPDDEAGQVWDDVASLVDKSLLRRMGQTQEGSEDQRLLMLETIREYGLEALIASGEEPAARHAHAVYFLHLAEEAEPALKGPLLVDWLERLEREHDNLRAALQWSLESGKGEVALRLAIALERFWVVRGQRNEGLAFLQKALAGSAEVTTTIRAKALLVAARLAFNQSNYAQGEILAQESLALFRELGDKRGIALSLNRLGVAAWRRGDFSSARVLLEEDLALFREMGDRDRVAWSLFMHGLLDSKQGEYARASSWFEESLALFRELGNKRGIAASLTQLAGTLFVSQGVQDMIYPLLEQGLSLDREVGDKEGMAVASLLLGWVALKQGDKATARSRVEEGLTLYREMEHREGIAEALCMLGKVEVARGDYTFARTLYEGSLAMAQEIGDKELIVSGLEGLAGVVAGQGELRWATQLWGTAEALREAIGAPLPPVDRDDYEQAVATARDHLGIEAFAATWAEGRAMTVEQVLTVREQAIHPHQFRQNQHLLR
ncbi:MAG TPA: tetratricopeptide repeat protein [Ktedonobacteraceae bacterium]|nr:tetratricopeptide repeat protein [Ktedonobacteraceae bacterium]